MIPNGRHNLSFHCFKNFQGNVLSLSLLIPVLFARTSSKRHIHAHAYPCMDTQLATKNISLSIKLFHRIITINDISIDTVSNPTLESNYFNLTSLHDTYTFPKCFFLRNCSNQEINVLMKHPAAAQSEVCQTNLTGATLRVAGVLSTEYAYDTSIILRKDGSFILEDSFAVELLRCLELTLKFKTKLIVTTFWGHLLPNKTWTGMIALLLADEADLGLSSIADRAFRRAVVDYNLPTNEIRIVAFFKRPSSISSETNALAKPFNTQFWIAVLLFLFLLALSPIIFKLAIEGKIFQQFPAAFGLRSTNINSAALVHESSTSTNLWSPSDAFQWSIAIITLQGFYTTPSHISYKISILVGYLAGFIINAAYSGTLISFLSVVSDPIQNWGQLVDTQYTFFVSNEPLLLKFLSDSPDPRNLKVYQRRQTEAKYSSLKDASKALLKGSFVYVTDHIGGYESLSADFSVYDACRLKDVGIDKAEQKQGTLVQRNSPYKRIIDFQILRMIEHGLVKRWNSKYLTQKPECDSQSEYEGVPFPSVLLAFILLLLGILSGIVLVVLELITFGRMSKVLNSFGI